MKRLSLIITFILAGYCASAQTSHDSSATDQTRQPVVSANENLPDHQTGKHKGLMHNELLENTDSLTASDYMMSIERVNDKLNSIRDSATLEFEFGGIKKRVDDMNDDITLIRNNIRGRNTVVNIRNLYLYQSFANNLKTENNRFQKHVTETFDRVYNAKTGLKTILADTVFHSLYDNDNLRKTYEKRLTRLEKKWSRTDSITRANIDTINAVKVKVADNAMSLSAIISIVDARLEKSSRQLFGQEVNYLWHKGKNENTSDNTSNKLINTLGSERKAIAYYINQTSGKRIFILFLAAVLFSWMFMRRKLLAALRSPGNKFSFMQLKHLNNYPVLSLLIALMCLMPFFDAYAPTSYLAIEFIVLLIIATAIFLKNEDKNFIFSWLFLVALFVVDAFAFLLVEPSLIARMWILIVHSAIIIFTWLFVRKLKKDRPYYKLIKIAATAGIVLASLGIICNILGRFSLSGILGFASIFAVTQVVILPLFIETITEVVLVQLQNSRMKKGFSKPFDISIVDKRVRIPLFIIAVILWFIMLASNLNIYHAVINGGIDFLTTPRTIGSISFKLVSVIWFFVIIWIAHILQKLISFIFGETGTETDEVTIVSKKQHSRLLITRLIVLVCGYLIAIAASGLPIDKLTIVLGALGVGIGMGLQNVVNNFVSGIILIFDGSLQIGDEIEVSGQSGKVKEIGLRASTLSTADGAEVIIPNGSILSQNIVNWTFSNDQKRIMIWFTLSGRELDSNVINEVINSTVTAIPNVLQQKKPVILYNRATPENCTITVRFWSTISNAEAVKSQAMLELSAAFEARKIKFE